MSMRRGAVAWGKESKELVRGLRPSAQCYFIWPQWNVFFRREKYVFING
jgi:hypothetical protein